MLYWIGEGCKDLDSYVVERCKRVYAYVLNRWKLPLFIQTIILMAIIDIPVPDPSRSVLEVATGRTFSWFVDGIYSYLIFFSACLACMAVLKTVRKYFERRQQVFYDQQHGDGTACWSIVLAGGLLVVISGWIAHRYQVSMTLAYDQLSWIALSYMFFAERKGSGGRKRRRKRLSEFVSDVMSRQYQPRSTSM